MNSKEIKAYVIHNVENEFRFENIRRQMDKDCFNSIEIFEAFTPKTLKESNNNLYELFFTKQLHLGLQDHSEEYKLKNYCLMLGHVGIIKKAKSLGLERVLVLEDDFNIKNSQKLLELNIPQNFSILHLGGYFDPRHVQETNDLGIYKIKECSGSFAYLVNHGFYDEFINTFEREYNNMLFTIDGFFARKFYETYDCLAFIPALINTIQSMSELMNRQTDHYGFFKNLWEMNE
jgi:GR25 family glycosyltransferase involved in LPS biosynthesis